MQQAKHLSEVFDISCGRYHKNLSLMSASGKGFTCVSFGKLHADVLKWADFLRSKGVQPGDRVVAVSAKCQNHFRFAYACWRLGAIAVPVCESLGDDEMSFIVSDCEPRLILASPAYLKKAKTNSNGVECIDWETIPLADEAGNKTTYTFTILI